MKQKDKLTKYGFERILGKIEPIIPEYMEKGNISKPEFCPYGDNTYFIEYKTGNEPAEKQDYIDIMSTLIKENVSEKKNNEYYLRVTISVSKPSKMQRESLARIMDDIGMEKVPNKNNKDGHYVYSKLFKNKSDLEDYWLFKKEDSNDMNYLEKPIFQ